MELPFDLATLEDMATLSSFARGEDYYYSNAVRQLTQSTAYMKVDDRLRYTGAMYLQGCNMTAPRRSNGFATLQTGCSSRELWTCSPASRLLEKIDQKIKPEIDHSVRVVFGS